MTRGRLPHAYTSPRFQPACRERDVVEKGEVGLGSDAPVNGARPVDASELGGDAPFADLDEIRNLIAQGQDRGFLTFQQIASTLEEVEVTKEQVQRLHTYLIDHGVDVIGE